MQNNFEVFLKVMVEKSKEFVNSYNLELLEYLELYGVEALKERLKKTN